MQNLSKSVFRLGRASEGPLAVPHCQQPYAWVYARPQLQIRILLVVAVPLHASMGAKGSNVAYRKTKGVDGSAGQLLAID